MTPTDLRTCSELLGFLNVSFKGATFGPIKMDDAVASLGRVLAFAESAAALDQPQAVDDGEAMRAAHSIMPGSGARFKTNEEIRASVRPISDGDVEPVARAICRSAGNNPDSVFGDGSKVWTAYAVHARAAISATRPAPVEAMAEALREAEAALASSYQVVDFPANGKSQQDAALAKVRAALGGSDA